MSAIASRTGAETYEFGPFRADTQQQRLLRSGQPIPLTPKTFQLLVVFLRHGQEVVTKDELMQAVWPNTFVEETNLTRNIFALRKVLGDTDQDRYIVTVPGQGYRFARDVQLVPDQHVSVLAATQSRVQIQVGAASHWTRTAWIAAAVVAAGLVAADAPLHLSRKPVLTSKDAVVLADFDNSTGDPVFDGTLRQGLAVELEQSPYLSLVSDDRVRRTLRLMDQPAGTHLPVETADEVCERAGAAVVLQGSITAVGKQYVLGLRARDCRTGEVVDDEQAQAGSKEDVLATLSRIASRFRTRVGESRATVQKYSTPLQEATTPSLDALKAYSAGWQVHAAHGAVAALPFFRRAIELDPNFAMAHASLARLYEDLDQPDLAAGSAERSWQLRDRTSEAERFFLTANYELLATGNLEAAHQICEAWTKEYPREPRAHSLLAGMINKTPGRYDEALAEARNVIAVDPDFWVGYYSLGANHLYLGNASEAEKALRAARSRGLDADELIMLAYDIAFFRSDVAGLQHEAALARARPDGENWISARESLVAAYSGHMSEARALSRRAVDQALHASQPERAALWQTGAAIREALFGNRAAANDAAADALKLSRNREVEYGAAFAFGLAGDPSRAQSLADDLDRRSSENTATRYSYLPVLRALLALDRDEPAASVDALQIAAPHELGVPLSSVSGLFGAIYPAYVRGLAFLAEHKGEQAASEFQKVLAHRGIVAADPIGALARLQLGRAYALSGDSVKARAAYSDFLDLWRDADPDLAILAQARTEYARLK